MVIDKANGKLQRISSTYVIERVSVFQFVVLDVNRMYNNIEYPPPPAHLGVKGMAFKS